jgi:exopolysaccharide biosynthesis polyprenyl glycosylphosphotransferase
MDIRDTSETSMIFAPRHRKAGRLQLRLSERRLLMMAGDALAVTIAVLLALYIWSIVGEKTFDLDFVLPQTMWFFVLNGLWFLLASANDYYDFPLAADRFSSLQRLIVISLQMLVVYVLVFFFSERDALPRLFIIYFGVASFVLLLLWRFLNPALVGWASMPRRALVVGTDWAAETIISILKQQHTSHAYQIVGVIGATSELGQTVSGVEVLGDGETMLNVVLREAVTEIVVTSTRELAGDIFQGVMDAYERGIVITPMPILYERVTERVPVEHVGDNWAVVLPISGISVFNPYPILKRLADIVMALIGLLLFGLILPFIAFAIVLDSRGNIFYTQDRTGLNGRRFKIVKLRTMIPDAESKTGAVFAQKDDNRVTRVGRFMRKTRLDELPQLWNVLKGDMSMIGPRPERPEHIKRLQEKIPFYRTRHIIRPGLTGWAQVRYRYGANDEDSMIKLQYDLYYIRHQSLLLDLNIIVRTVRRILSMSGQ